MKTKNHVCASEHVLEEGSGNFFLAVIWHNREISKSSLCYLSVYISSQLFMMMIIGNKMAEIKSNLLFFYYYYLSRILLPEGVYRCDFRLVVKKIFSLRVVVSSSQDKRKEWCRRSGWRWRGDKRRCSPSLRAVPPRKPALWCAPRFVHAFQN